MVQKQERTTETVVGTAIICTVNACVSTEALTAQMRGVDRLCAHI